ncbi:hypothetical protein PM082_010633 [Marasmius tenuissimus]|nr:hypothetical protein PM082_010633 [Marasmius tenuissimus]
MRVTTINFQRASCTLDGCIEIWTSRLDSVGTETVKLASNLASGRTGDGEDEDDDASDDPDGDRTEKRRKKNQRTVKTLVTDPAHRKVKKLDLERCAGIAHELEEEVEDEREDLIDLTQLRNEFISDLQALKSKAICHSHSWALKIFEIELNSAYLAAKILTGNCVIDNTYAGPDDDFSPDFDMNGGPETEEDFFTGNDAVNDDFGGNTMGGNDFDGAT